MNILQAIELYTYNSILQYKMMQEEGLFTSFNVNNDVQEASKTSDLYGTARAAFIQKVYTVLTIQILVTVFFILLSMFNQAFFIFQVQNTAFLYLALIAAFVVQIYMFCCNGGRTYPSNYVCLTIFTLSEAYVVSFISSVTGYQSGNGVVLLAGVYTLVIVVVLTIYACNTEEDFTTKYGIVLVLLAVLIVLGITSFFISSPFLTNLYCAVGVFLFGVYLIIDTQMIMGGKHVQLRIDEYAIAALMLYIDIIQIFLYILRMLGGKEQ